MDRQIQIDSGPVPGKPLEILISGAGIAGPALACWLHRYGHSVTIVEKAEDIRKGGYRVDIRGVAVTVAEKMGIMDKVHKMATHMKRATLVNKKGRTIADIDPETLGMRRKGDVEIMRGDLASILYDATRPYTEYIFDDSITALQQDRWGVTATFQRGMPRRFDLVVEADGLRSNVRGLVFGEDEIKVSDLGYYISIFSTPNYFNLDHREIAYPSPGKVINVFHCDGQTDAKALFLFSSKTPAREYRHSGRQMALLRDTFQHAGWEAPLLLEAMTESPDFYFDAVSQIRMNTHSKGRIVLLGDAAWCPSPASGQGTSLALTGAYILAGELAKVAGDYHIAFAAYDRLMRDYIDKNQQLGRTVLKEMVPQSRSAIRMQSFFLRVLLRVPGTRSLMQSMMVRMQKLVDEAANAIQLPVYQ